MSEQVVLDEKSAEGLVARIVNAIKPKEVPKVEAPTTPIAPPVPAAPVAGKLSGLTDDEVAALTDVIGEEIDRRIADAVKKQEPPKPAEAPTPPPTEAPPKATTLEELKNKPVPPPPDVGKGIVETTLPPGSPEADLTEKILAEMREKPMESLAEFLRWNLERKKTE